MGVMGWVTSRFFVRTLLRGSALQFAGGIPQYSQYPAVPVQVQYLFVICVNEWFVHDVNESSRLLSTFSFPLPYNIPFVETEHMQSADIHAWRDWEWGKAETKEMDGSEAPLRLLVVC